MERIISSADLHDLTVKAVKLEAGKELPSDLEAVCSILLTGASAGDSDVAPTVDGSSDEDQLVFVLVK